MIGNTLGDVLANGVGIERSFLCPVHPDSHPSASVNTIKMVWVCYACGAHGRVGEEALLADIDFDALRRQLRKQATAPEPYPESWLNVFDAPDHPYWLSRYSRTACAHFRLGWDHALDCATIPLRSAAGDVLGVVRRRLDGSGPRYHYPYGVDIGRQLFNLEGVDAPVLVLTEGATDAVAAWEAGVDAVGIYGSALREPQAALLRAYDPYGIICAFDMDEAGTTAYKSVLGQLREYPISRVTWSSAKGKDISALSVQERSQILSSALARYGNAA